MRVTNQGGSLAGFLIIGALLTLVLVGGLYGLNRYNSEKSNEEVAANDEKKAESDDKKATETFKTDDAGRRVTGSGDTSNRTSTTPTPAQTTPSATTEQTQSSQATSQLPQTGPADSAFMLIVVTLVTFAGVHYAQSRARL